MYTEREKQVLGQYLTWYMAMRSEREESEQYALMNVLEKAKKSNPEATYIIVEFDEQTYGYFRQSDETYLLDDLAIDVINTYEKNKNNATKILFEKYGDNVNSAKINDILYLISGGM